VLSRLLLLHKTLGSGSVQTFALVAVPPQPKGQEMPPTAGWDGNDGRFTVSAKWSKNVGVPEHETGLQPSK
jgi:hypothetical protein